MICPLLIILIDNIVALVSCELGLSNQKNYGTNLYKYGFTMSLKLRNLSFVFFKFKNLGLSNLKNCFLFFFLISKAKVLIFKN